MIWRKMKLKILACLMTVFLLLSGCQAGMNGNAAANRYQTSFLNLFDTVTTIVGYAENEAQFQEQCQKIRDELEFYHELFDVYHDYPGINNVKTVNDNAGVAPVEVDPVLIDLLVFSREIYDQTDGRVNAAMGSVLKLWHESRTVGTDDPEAAALPEEAALREAAEHISFDGVVIDTEKRTVFLSDPLQRLDVGAVAKGYAAELVRRSAPSGYLISVGGNLCANGPRADGTPWVVGLENPDGGDYLHTLNVSGGCVVTSGDYQRYYTVNGVRYHHIIDPQTLMPSRYWRSVTILCEDSGLADALSTALFLMPQAEGQRLLDHYHAEALWVDPDGNEFFSPGFSACIRS